MKKQLFSLASGMALATLVALAPAQADTTTARCDVYPRGDDRATSSDTCSFSQRQGYVTITLKDGTTYELTPSSTEPATYTDQNGRPATREDVQGTTGVVIYRLADVSIFVYWDATTVSSEPRRGGGNVPCSAGQPSYNRLCQAAALYGDGHATLTLIGPGGDPHHLYYDGHTMYSSDPGDQVVMQVVDGQYLVSVNDTEFFSLDEIMVTGAD